MTLDTLLRAGDAAHSAGPLLVVVAPGVVARLGVFPRAGAVLAAPLPVAVRPLPRPASLHADDAAVVALALGVTQALGTGFVVTLGAVRILAVYLALAVAPASLLAAL